MKNNNELEDFLKEKMSLDETSDTHVPFYLVSEARKKVMARKKANEKPDIFFLIARFLNLHIRLPFAAVFVLAIALGSFYLTRENNDSAEGMTSSYVVNIASARSSTVLSSIVTFESQH